MSVDQAWWDRKVTLSMTRGQFKALAQAARELKRKREKELRKRTPPFVPPPGKVNKSALQAEALGVAIDTIECMLDFDREFTT